MLEKQPWSSSPCNVSHQTCLHPTILVVKSRCNALYESHLLVFQYILLTRVLIIARGEKVKTPVFCWWISPSFEDISIVIQLTRICQSTSPSLLVAQSCLVLKSIYTYTYTYIHTQMRTYVYIYRYIHCIYIYTHIYTFTYSNSDGVYIYIV